MGNREEEAAAPNQRQGQEQLNIRMQMDKGIDILTGQTLNQNFQQSQKKMQKHICYTQMIGWKPITLKKV